MDYEHESLIGRSLKHFADLNALSFRFSTPRPTASILLDRGTEPTEVFRMLAYTVSTL